MTEKESGPMTERRFPAQLDIAWLLIETWRDKSEHIEGIALTHEAKDAFMRGHYEVGQSRTAMPYKIKGLRESASAPSPQPPVICDQKHGGTPCADRDCHVRFIDEETRD